ncbi:MAG: TerC/Alx family metal homeostasis membrane protein [Bacteroidia bacterium]|nr:TerC/Alx family metal homeostasis membrane protein [Bacteroidia bacterium]MDW8235061.1 TerC/Alx family metal homeostasis membrane protein [Bacteroidia bacterium]
MDNYPVLLVFVILVIIYLFFDLGIFQRQPRAITFRQALWQSLIIVIIALSFGVYVYLQNGWEAAIEYYSAYTMEYALSMDNIFVILLIFRYFSIEQSHYHKVLFWGVVGAMVMRGIFIFAGIFLIKHFHWLLYLFGAFLVWAGLKNLISNKDEEHDLGKSPILRLMTRYLRITTLPHEGKFVIVRQGRRFFTLLALALLMIEITDLIFAVDSIPAAFAITQNEGVLFSSNILAVMGLRSMFFLLAAVIERFWALEYGISIVLVGIGLKMFQGLFGVHVPPELSLLFIIFMLAGSILLSIFVPRKDEEPSAA